MDSVRVLCEQLIMLKRTEGLQEKLDVFLANDRLTVEEYTDLTAGISHPTATPTVSA